MYTSWSPWRTNASQHTIPTQRHRLESTSQSSSSGNLHTRCSSHVLPGDDETGGTDDAIHDDIYYIYYILDTMNERAEVVA